MTTFVAGRSEVRVVVEARDFALLQNVHTVSVRVRQTASCSMGAGVLSLPGGGEGERPGREIDQSHPCS